MDLIVFFHPIQQLFSDWNFHGKNQACIYGEIWFWIQSFIKIKNILDFLENQDSNASNKSEKKLFKKFVTNYKL